MIIYYHGNDVTSMIRNHFPPPRIATSSHARFSDPIPRRGGRNPSNISEIVSVSLLENWGELPVWKKKPLRNRSSLRMPVPGCVANQSVPTLY
ncbi:hypothetical protein CDAR_249531 [Caerostris darwini]|uniref:Ycf15 n=1 Tax=Caerostris darwini TaxID=1538125 RepID=A0AAV4RGA6_9ARAC|nr:hypothetical protein CDAR_249531 [Caerostris darwini]